MTSHYTRHSSFQNGLMSQGPSSPGPVPYPTKTAWLCPPLPRPVASSRSWDERLTQRLLVQQNAARGFFSSTDISGSQTKDARNNTGNGNQENLASDTQYATDDASTQGAIPPSEEDTVSARGVRKVELRSKRRGLVPCQHHVDDDDDDFWLPEFKGSLPTTPEPVFTLPCGKRDRWLKKTRRVSMEKEAEGKLHLSELNCISTSTPPCQCAVCRLVDSTTLLSPIPQQEEMKELNLVSHGIHRFTVFPTRKPWQRQLVQHCTNPRPLVRRMPEVVTGENDVVNHVYRLKMLPPGKVIKDKRKQQQKEAV